MGDLRDSVGLPSESALIVSRAIKILLTFDWFLKLVVEGQARALADLGHDVRLLCRDHALEFGGDASERRHVLDALEANGIGRWELSGRRYGPEGLPETIRVSREIRAWSPDVVSAHQNDDPRLRWASGRAPVVYTIHDPRAHPGAATPALAERVGAAVWLRSADRLVVHAKQLVAELPRKAVRKPVRIVPLGIDVAAVPLPAPLEPVVLLFGRLERYKGISVLVAAMQSVWRMRPETRLVIAGRGPAAAEIPADERIEFTEGYVSEEAVDALLARASVIVLPYTQASQSAVGLLALSRGVPTVVTRTGGLPELALDGRYLAEPGDAGSLAQRLLSALDAPADERQRVLDFARRRFSWRTVAESYLAVYEELVGLESNPE